VSEQTVPEDVMADYRAAYLAANGRSISVAYNRGWFVLDTGPYQTRHRRQQVEGFTAELRRRVQSLTTPNESTPHHG